AILFESGSHLTCDVVVTVEADEAMRVNRARARAAKSGESVPSEADIRARLNRQWSRELRVAQSDFVLENGVADALMPQVLETFEHLLLRSR
ncbi:MAG: dephospho-CoA kinase, partial [Flavobacteriales bacterium]|nr:dephospho-CoA kinase [Flavobacteriales bacterium]